MTEDPTGKIVYVAPMDALVKERFEDWSEKFGGTPEPPSTLQGYLAHKNPPPPRTPL